MQVLRTLTVASARSRDLPAFVFRVTEGTGPTAVAARVVVRVLVEGDGVGRVEVAEDVAATTAVVAAGEIGEGSRAGGFVADGSFVVRLEKIESVRMI